MKRSEADAEPPGPRDSWLAKLLPLATLLFTGTVSTLLAQHVIDRDIADNSVQHLALTKYMAILALAPVNRAWGSMRDLCAGSEAMSRPAGSRGAGEAAELPRRSRRATVLLMTLAVLDVCSYFVHCLGFALCGSALATVVFAAAAQLLTAAMTRFVLGRRLLRGQQLAVRSAVISRASHYEGDLTKVGLVFVGICLRGAAFGSSRGAKGGAHDGAATAQAWGLAAILTSALGYSTLGVVYDLLLSTESPPPTHAEVMQYTSKLGLAVSLGYQALYTVPRWRRLVGSHLEATGTTGAQALGLLLAFGAFYNVHNIAQGAVQKSDGALGVGLVTAVRSATVSLASGLLFCSPAAPAQCLTPLSAASALIVTVGGIAWVSAVAPAPGKRKQA